MARFKHQSEKELALHLGKKYVFKHVRTGEVCGFNDKTLAQVIAPSPSWKAYEYNAEEVKKHKPAKLGAALEKVEKEKAQKKYGKKVVKEA